MKQALALLLALLCCTASAAQPRSERLYPGVTRISCGEPDRFTPYSQIAAAPAADALNARQQGPEAIRREQIAIEINDRGTVIDIPLDDGEQLYGFGLQIGSFQQRGLKKRPVVNDYPLNNLGPSHGAQTLYVSNRGYCIVVNTARYTTFLNGTHGKRNEEVRIRERDEAQRTMEELYGARTASNYVRVDIPGARGIELFLFEGRDLKAAIERYNLFCGGGALPPMWGLGIKYRMVGDADAKAVEAMADYFRSRQIPCDVIGLEPGWQTRAYSCSYVWNAERFPDPQATIGALARKSFRVNLWEHAYVHPEAPFHEAMKPCAGDYEVWGGLVPDFTTASARSLFADYHERELVDKGIMGFKMDECDGSNLFEGGANWGFPDHARFPSGIYGDQMRQMFGALYASTINGIFRARNLRTYADYRASSIFMSPLPGVLYSDTYDHREYIRMIANSGFGGLLWSPELRETHSRTELIQRMQTLLMSAQAVFNNWYMPSPSWLQYDREKNNRGELLPDAGELEALARTLINQRMALVPYLYTAFAAYRFCGTPPFRALVVDYPDDEKVFQTDDQFLIGESLMAAPFYDGQSEREVYFPEGAWYDLHTRERYEGGRSHRIAYAPDRLPLFAKEHSVIPLAAPVEAIGRDVRFEITCHVFGEGPASGRLYADDGETYDFEKGHCEWVELAWDGKRGRAVLPRKAAFATKRYAVGAWRER